MNETDLQESLGRRVDLVPEPLEATPDGQVLCRFEDGSVLALFLEGPYELTGPDGTMLARGDTTGLVSPREGYAELLGLLAVGLLGGCPRGATGTSWNSGAIRTWASAHAGELRALTHGGGR